MKAQQYILTIAGHDPSGGAGLTSDIKTFEAHGLYGLSVCSAITIQNDINFKNCIWVEKNSILSQIETLFERFRIPVVKIGIVENWNVLLEILNKLHRLNTNIKIVLDPIIRATAGFDFHTNENQNLLGQVFDKCFIITPNYDEIKQLYPTKNIQETISFILKKTNIYLKGGHRKEKKGWDILYYKNTSQINITPKTETVFEKHGSGCVLSSALASNIVLELHLEDAAREAKYYTEQFLNSNKTLLGYHFPINKS